MYAKISNGVVEQYPHTVGDLRRKNRLLAKTDYMALSDTTLTPEWATYRQALRDITEQQGFPPSVTWPVKPE